MTQEDEATWWAVKNKRPTDLLNPGASSSVLSVSGPDHVRSLESIFGFRQLELHLISLCKGTKAIGYDG